MSSSQTSSANSRGGGSTITPSRRPIPANYPQLPQQQQQQYRPDARLPAHPYASSEGPRTPLSPMRRQQPEPPLSPRTPMSSPIVGEDRSHLGNSSQLHVGAGAGTGGQQQQHLLVGSKSSASFAAHSILQQNQQLRQTASNSENAAITSRSDNYDNSQNNKKEDVVPRIIAAFDVLKIGGGKRNPRLHRQQGRENEEGRENGQQSSPPSAGGGGDAKARVLLIRTDALFFLDVEGHSTQDGLFPDVIKRHIPIGKIKTVSYYSRIHNVITLSVYGEHDVFFHVLQETPVDVLERDILTGGLGALREEELAKRLVAHREEREIQRKNESSKQRQQQQQMFSSKTKKGNAGSDGLGLGSLLPTLADLPPVSSYYSYAYDEVRNQRVVSRNTTSGTASTPAGGGASSNVNFPPLLPYATPEERELSIEQRFGDGSDEPKEQYKRRIAAAARACFDKLSEAVRRIGFQNSFADLLVDELTDAKTFVREVRPSLSLSKGAYFNLRLGTATPNGIISDYNQMNNENDFESLGGDDDDREDLHCYEDETEEEAELRRSRKPPSSAIMRHKALLRRDAYVGCMRAAAVSNGTSHIIQTLIANAAAASAAPDSPEAQYAKADFTLAAAATATVSAAQISGKQYSATENRSQAYGMMEKPNNKVMTAVPPPISESTRVTLRYWDSITPDLSVSLSVDQLLPTASLELRRNLSREHIVMMGSISVRFHPSPTAERGEGNIHHHQSSTGEQGSGELEQARLRMVSSAMAAAPFRNLTVLFTPAKMYLLNVANGRAERQYPLFAMRKIDLHDRTSLRSGGQQQNQNQNPASNSPTREITVHFLEDVTSSVTFAIPLPPAQQQLPSTPRRGGSNNNLLSPSSASSSFVFVSSPTAASSGSRPQSPVHTTRTIIEQQNQSQSSSTSSKSTTNDVNAVGNVMRFLLKREGVDLRREHFTDGMPVERDSFVKTTGGPVLAAADSEQRVREGEEREGEGGPQLLAREVSIIGHTALKPSQSSVFELRKLVGDEYPIAGAEQQGGQKLLAASSSSNATTTGDEAGGRGVVAANRSSTLRPAEFDALSPHEKRRAMEEAKAREAAVRREVPDFREPIDPQSRLFLGPTTALARQILRLTSKGVWEPRTLVLHTSGALIIADNTSDRGIRRSIPLAQITEITPIEHHEGPALALGVSQEHDLVFKLANNAIGSVLNLQQVVIVMLYLQEGISVMPTEKYVGKESMRKVLRGRNFNKPKDYLSVQDEFRIVNKERRPSPRRLKIILTPTNVYDTEGRLTPRRCAPESTFTDDENDDAYQRGKSQVSRSNYENNNNNDNNNHTNNKARGANLSFSEKRSTAVTTSNNNSFGTSTNSIVSPRATDNNPLRPPDSSAPNQQKKNESFGRRPAAATLTPSDSRGGVYSHLRIDTNNANATTAAAAAPASAEGGGASAQGRSTSTGTATSSRRHEDGGNDDDDYEKNSCSIDNDTFVIHTNNTSIIGGGGGGGAPASSPVDVDSRVDKEERESGVRSVVYDQDKKGDGQPMVQEHDKSKQTPEDILESRSSSSASFFGGHGQKMKSLEGRTTATFFEDTTKSTNAATVAEPSFAKRVPSLRTEESLAAMAMTVAKENEQRFEAKDKQRRGDSNQEQKVHEEEPNGNASRRRAEIETPSTLLAATDPAVKAQIEALKAQVAALQQALLEKQHSSDAAAISQRTTADGGELKTPLLPDRPPPQSPLSSAVPLPPPRASNSGESRRVREESPSRRLLSSPRGSSSALKARGGGGGGLAAAAMLQVAAVGLSRELENRFMEKIAKRQEEERRKNESPRRLVDQYLNSFISSKNINTGDSYSFATPSSPISEGKDTHLSPVRETNNDIETLPASPTQQVQEQTQHIRRGALPQRREPTTRTSVTTKTLHSSSLSPSPLGSTLHAADAEEVARQRSKLIRDAMAMHVVNFRIKVGVSDVLIAPWRGSFIEQVLEAAAADEEEEQKGMASTSYSGDGYKGASKGRHNYESKDEEGMYRDHRSEQFNELSISSASPSLAATRPACRFSPAYLRWKQRTLSSPSPHGQSSQKEEEASKDWDDATNRSADEEMQLRPQGAPLAPHRHGIRNSGSWNTSPNQKCVMVCSELPLVLCVTRQTLYALIMSSYEEGSLVSPVVSSSAATPTAAPSLSPSSLIGLSHGGKGYYEDGGGGGVSFTSAETVMCRSANSYRWAPVSVARAAEAIVTAAEVSLTRLVDQYEAATAALARSNLEN